jgi:hypothetical protein
VRVSPLKQCPIRALVPCTCSHNKTACNACRTHAYGC